MDQALKSGTNPRDVKIKLAGELVRMYHGETESTQAQEDFVNVFKKGGVPDEMPEFKLNGDRNIVDLLILCNLIKTKSEGRQVIEQGGVRVNEEKIDTHEKVIHLEEGMIVQVGKRRFAKIV